jgi:hypothetical protein
MKILFIILVLSLIQIISPYYSFEAYRLIQYDKEQTNLGSRRTSFNSPIEIPRKQNETGKINSESLLGKVKSFSRDFIILNIQEIANLRTEEKIINEITERADVNSILIVLPKDISKLSKETINCFQKLETFLLSQEIQKSVYFSFEDEEISHIQNSLSKEKSSTIFSETFQAEVNEKEAVLLPKVEIINFESMLVKDTKLPTIGIVAHYDTLSAVPELT